MPLFGRFPSRGQPLPFTERVRAVLARARDEAVALGHEYVGTEHLLLAVLRDESGIPAAVLDTLGVNRARMRAAMLTIVKSGPVVPIDGRDLPYTSRAKHVLDLAMAEATAFDHVYVGTEHLLLGLIREEKGIAAQTLADAGVRFDTVHAETARLLGPQRPDATPQAPPERPSLVATLPSRPILRDTTEAAREEMAWARLRNALDVTARLGAAPRLTLAADGSLTVSLGSDLVVSVDFPASVRLRSVDTPASDDAPPAA